MKVSSAKLSKTNRATPVVARVEAAIELVVEEQDTIP